MRRKPINFAASFVSLFATLFAIVSCKLDRGQNSNHMYESADGSNSSPIHISGDDSFVPSFSSQSVIYYWKNEQSEYRFGTGEINGSSLNPGGLVFFKEMQTSKNCSLSTMKEVIKRQENIDIYRSKLFEINYPMEIEDCQALGFMCIPDFPSRDIAIYEELGLLDVYNHYYGASKQVYCNSMSFASEDEKLFDIYPKHFTNLSHIYVWQNEDLEYYCGISSEQDNDVASLTSIRYFQESLPCSLANMKKIVDKYYEIMKIRCENFIIEIPIINENSGWKEYVKNPYPNNISSNRSLYEQLGILDSYNHYLNANSWAFM